MGTVVPKKLSRDEHIAHLLTQSVTKEETFLTIAQESRQGPRVGLPLVLQGRRAAEVKPSDDGVSPVSGSNVLC